MKKFQLNPRWYSNLDAVHIPPAERMVQMGEFSRTIDRPGNIESTLVLLEALANGELS